ncbi:MAG: pentapeptide repeat-containing protein [Alphaproteobacteria bacterium]|nr:pentapeptide repeat-containing protein [Alphaproteobacteria bacterium]
MWRFAAIAALVTAMATPALAYERAVNPSCKLEAEANCNWGNLYRAKAKGLDLRDAAFLSAILDEGDFEGANFEQALMQLTYMRGGNFKNANFTRAHMHATKMQGANLEGAILDHTNLTSSNMEGANLKGASLKNAMLMNAKLSGATWIDGRVCAAGSIGECK